MFQSLPFFTPFLYLFKMSINPFLNACNAHVKTYICLCTETQASIGLALCLDPTSPLAQKIVWRQGFKPRNIRAYREQCHSDSKHCGHSAPENCAKLGMKHAVLKRVPDISCQPAQDREWDPHSFCSMRRKQVLHTGHHRDSKASCATSVPSVEGVGAACPVLGVS